MKSAKRQKIINEIRHLRGVEPVVAESGILVAYQLVRALDTGKRVLIPRPRIGRVHQLHRINGKIVYGDVRPLRMYGAHANLQITIDEFTDELTVEPADPVDNDWTLTSDAPTMQSTTKS